MNAPWCPKCGGEMVRPIERSFNDGTAADPVWSIWCDGCGFSDTHERAPECMPARADAIKYARRLVRRELAEQALTMRAHGQAWCTEVSAATPSVRGQGPYNLSNFVDIVNEDYEWLGKNPIRLPGEDEQP